jgi:type IV pilus assembly protein PilY1
MTDGFYNGGSPNLSPSSNTDGDDNTDFDGGSYGDSDSNTLADVAMHYYERDLDTSLSNEVPVWESSVDQAKHQHMNTITVAFGVNGTLDPHDTKTPGISSDTDPTDAGFVWPNPTAGDAQKIDDLWHAAYNGRGQFYSATDATSLAQGLADAFASVTRGTSSSSAVAFNTTTLDTGSRVYQATFNPSDNWYGDLVAYELQDDGEIVSSPVWHASDVLDTMLPSERVILTYNESAKKGVAFKTLGDLSTKQQNDLNMSPTDVSDALGQARLDYIRGSRTDENAGNNFRERTNVLGDIVYSNPVYVGDPQSNYEDASGVGDGSYSNFNPNRDPVIYVGSNDGMLHGFWEDDGSEAIAYIPNMLFSNASSEGLHYLTDPAYGHRYYVDLSPTVADVYINSSWKTILIGGYRAGGRGLFALDVTNPSSFSDAQADNVVLWEFTSNDNNSLGNSFSKPTMALMENGKWAAVFGNGYDDLGDGEAKLFILYLEGGMDRTWSSSDYKVITTGVGSSGDRNGLSTPALVDSDGNGKADRVYAGDLKGNLWAFDLSDPDNDSNWGVAYSKALFNATVVTTPQPITSKPVVARNPAVTTTVDNSPNILVFFGTGQYMVNGDKTSSDTQTFYGVWDNNDVGSGSTLTRDSLVAQTLDTDNSTSEIRVVSDNSVDYASKYGWRFDLPTSGERVVVDPKIRGDYIFFNTLIPDPNTCNTQGYGWLMALKLTNGGEPSKPVFDINNDGVVDENDQVDDADGDGKKSPSGVRLDGIPAGSNFLSEMMYTPDDDGDIDVRKIDAGNEDLEGRLSWREVNQ